VDRLIARGHGPGVYDYGLSWFFECLRAANEADATQAKAERIRRAVRMVDMRLAVNGTQEAFRDRIDDLLRESL